MNKYRYEVYVYPNTSAKSADTDEQEECQDYVYGEAKTLGAAKALAKKAQAEGLILHETRVYDATGKRFWGCIGEYDDTWTFSD